MRKSGPIKCKEKASLFKRKIGNLHIVKIISAKPTNINSIASIFHTTLVPPLTHPPPDSSKITLMRKAFIIQTTHFIVPKTY
jgi:hypothetical protein